MHAATDDLSEVNNGIWMTTGRMQAHVICIREGLVGQDIYAFMSDISKAYDTADRSFIRQTLVAFGFPTSYLHCFDAFHSNTQARVFTNGVLSPSFPVASGVRQGCPWAPMLFIMMAETLAQSIRTEPRIRGLAIPIDDAASPTAPQQHIVKFSAFADDATTFMTDWHSYRYLQHLFDDYAMASGNHLNLSKCKCYVLGPNAAANAAHIHITEPDLHTVTSKDFLLYLGVPFGASTTQFWQTRLDALQFKLQRLHQLGFSAFGRATSARTYALSSILFPLQYTSISTGSKVVTRLNSLYRNFVLNNKPVIPEKLGSECYRQSVNDAALHPKYGGLGLLNVPLYLSAARFMVLMRLLRSPDSATVVVLKAVLALCTFPFKLALHSLFCPHSYVTRLLKRSTSITALRAYILAWPLHRNSPAITTSMGMKEPLFFNSVIHLDEAIFGPSSRSLSCWRRIAAIGFTRVGHFLMHDHTLVRSQWLARLPRMRHSLDKFADIDAACMRFRLPDDVVSNHPQPVDSPLQAWLATWTLDAAAHHNLTTVSTRKLYTRALLSLKADLPLVSRAWAATSVSPRLQALRFTVYKRLWSMHLPRKWMDSLFAVLNNTLPTTNKVCRSHLQNTCPLCSAGPDSLDHILFNCPLVHDLWAWAHYVYGVWHPHSRLLSTPMTFTLWLSLCLDMLQLPALMWQWFFWCIPVLRALWLSRNAAVFGDAAWSLPTLQSYCISQWLSCSLLLLQHYPAVAFSPLMSFTHPL